MPREEDYPVSSLAFQEKMRLIKDDTDGKFRDLRQDYRDEVNSIRTDMKDNYVKNERYNRTEGNVDWLTKFFWLLASGVVGSLLTNLFSLFKH